MCHEILEILDGCTAGNAQRTLKYENTYSICVLLLRVFLSLSFSSCLSFCIFVPLSVCVRVYNPFADEYFIICVFYVQCVQQIIKPLYRISC